MRECRNRIISPLIFLKVFPFNLCLSKFCCYWINRSEYECKWILCSIMIYHVQYALYILIQRELRILYHRLILQFSCAIFLYKPKVILVFPFWQYESIWYLNFLWFEYRKHNCIFNQIKFIIQEFNGKIWQMIMPQRFLCIIPQTLIDAYTV